MSRDYQFTSYIVALFRQLTHTNQANVTDASNFLLLLFANVGATVSSPGVSIDGVG